MAIVRPADIGEGLFDRHSLQVASGVGCWVLVAGATE